MKMIAKIDKNQKLASCNFVKAILMIIVVFYHCFAFWTGSWFTQNPVFKSPVLSAVASWLTSFHIYGFTLISGYIFYYIKYEKNGYSKYIPFIKNKIKRLIIPYIFVALIWVIPIQCLFFDYTPIDIFVKYGLATSPSQLWFLIMLFAVFAIFWPLSQFFKNHDICGILIALLLYGIGLFSPLPNIFSIWTACRYIIFFLLGFKLRQHGTNLIYKIPSIVWLVIDIILFALLKYINFPNSLFFKMLKYALSFLLNIIGATASFVILQKISYTSKRIRENKAVLFFYKLSMPIYLFHQQLIYFSVYLFNGKMNPYLNAALNLVIAISVSVAISLIFMKFNPTRYLMGEKTISKERQKANI